MALAHSVGGVEGHYRRGDLLLKRTKMMEMWATFLAHRGVVLQMKKVV